MALELFFNMVFYNGIPASNGVPHFVFGAAGKIFRSPFGQKSKPRVNILWGLSNFVLATIIAIGMIVLNLYSSYALLAMLLGFWLTMLMFGSGIKRFLELNRQ